MILKVEFPFYSLYPVWALYPVRSQIALLGIGGAKFVIWGMEMDGRKTPSQSDNTNVLASVYHRPDTNIGE